MFLVTMAHGIIANEIGRLRKISDDKDKALKESEKMLLKDKENFEKYLEANRIEKIEAEKGAEK